MATAHQAGWDAGWDEGAKDAALSIAQDLARIVEDGTFEHPQPSADTIVDRVRETLNMIVADHALADGFEFENTDANRIVEALNR